MKQVTAKPASRFWASRLRFKETQRILWVCGFIWFAAFQSIFGQGSFRSTFGQGIISTNSINVMPFNYDYWTPVRNPKIITSNFAGPPKATPSFGTLEDSTKPAIAFPDSSLESRFGRDSADLSVRMWVLAPTFCLILLCLALTAVMFRKQNRRAARNCLVAAAVCAALGTILVLFLEAAGFR